jgi:hypothetical protein
MNRVLALEDDESIGEVIALALSQEVQESMVRREMARVRLRQSMILKSVIS